MQGATAVEDIVEDQNVAGVDVGQRMLIEGDRTAALGAAVIACDAEGIELERQRNPSEEVGHEHQRAVQYGDDGELLAAIVLGDLRGELIETGENGLLVKEDGFDIVEHGDILGGGR
jgi:hypothetical protein